MKRKVSTSRTPGGFDANEKLGLSKVTVNSTFSIRGFLNGILVGFAPGTIRIGPYIIN